MFKLLIDTCVWLDLAKDPKQVALLEVLEELVKRDEVSLLVPKIVINEFHRNKARVAREATQSISSALKRVKDAVWSLDHPRRRRHLMQRLNDVDMKLPTLGEAAIESIGRIERLLVSSPVLEAEESVMARAARRAIDRRAPFHRGKNAMADAVLIEIYADCAAKTGKGLRFAFVTHNKHDFSLPDGDHSNPHPDIAPLFSRVKSLYFITLADALRRVDRALVADRVMFQEWSDEPRSAGQISDATGELTDKVWYNRHQNTRISIERGWIKVVEKETYPRPHGRGRENIQRNIWEVAKKSATKVEKRYGKKNLGPWSDFEWGMINGKLSALRWVLGEEWDELYT